MGSPPGTLVDQGYDPVNHPPYEIVAAGAAAIACVSQPAPPSPYRVANSPTDESLHRSSASTRSAAHENPRIFMRGAQNVSRMGVRREKQTCKKSPFLWGRRLVATWLLGQFSRAGKSEGKPGFIGC